MVRLLTLSGLILLLAAPTASAGVREKILRECQEGRITGDYTPGQLRDARKHIPTDIDEYSDCRDVLARAALTGRSGGGGGGGGGRGARRRAARRRQPTTLAYRGRPAEERTTLDEGARRRAAGRATSAGDKIVPGRRGPRGRRRAPRAADDAARRS